MHTPYDGIWINAYDADKHHGLLATKEWMDEPVMAKKLITDW